MDEMRPSLSEIFPRMNGSIGADEVLWPVGGWSFLVVALQCLFVVCPLVTKNVSKRLESAAVTNQAVSVEVPDLVAKVAKQGAVGLVHVCTRLLAHRVIGLCNVERDDTVLVPRQNFLRATVGFRNACQHVELQPRILFFGAGRQRKLPPYE